MSQQCGHSGTQSTPQKFLQLVGCRDPMPAHQVNKKLEAPASVTE